MTGPEHWEEADLILSSDPCEYGCPHGGCVHEMRMIARAQVHALLALAAATALSARERDGEQDPDGMDPVDRREWEHAASAGFADGGTLTLEGSTGEGQ